MGFSVLSIKSYKKHMKITILIISIIFITLFITGISILNSSKILPNIFIENADVGGLTPEEAKLKLKQFFEKEVESFRLELVHGDNNWQLSYEDLGVYYVFDDYISKAYGIGRTGNYYNRIKAFISLRKSPEIIKLEPYYDLLQINTIVEEISNTLNKSAIDAKIQRKNNEFVITKETLGIEVEKDNLKNIIKNSIGRLDNNKIYIPITNTKPEITEKDLDAIEDLIAGYSTTFNSAVIGRSENIKLGANSINSILLMPEKEFSFNETTGPRSVEAGYKEAPVIINGELVPDIGGGICQVSTTLYQAAVRSNLEIIERRNHGLPVGYVPMGQDATVAYGYIDFRFKNNKDYPIYIESYIKGERIFVNVYSKKTDTINISLESKVDEVIEPKVEIKKDTNIYIGESRIIKEAKRGYRVSTYKVYLQEGKEINRERISKDYYPPRDGFIIEGAKEL